MKTKHLLLVSGIFLFGLLSSCLGPREADKPENLIDQETMVSLMYEMGLNEASFRGRMHDDTLANEKVKQRIQLTMDTYKVTPEQYEESYQYYLKDPEQLVEIYNEVLARYSTKISEVEETVD